MSDEGQSYYELCRTLGKTPSELGDEPAPSRYFLTEAHAEYQRRFADHIDHE